MNEKLEQIWDAQRAERAQALIGETLHQYLSN